jgi:hypothetical protein
VAFFQSLGIVPLLIVMSSNREIYGIMASLHMTIKICLCQYIMLSEYPERRSPRVSVLSDTGQGHSDCSNSYFSRFLCAGLIYVRRNSAAIRDQYGASLQARSLTRGGLFPGRGIHLGALDKNIQKATVNFIASVCLSVCPPAWNNLGPTGQIFAKFDVRNLSTKLNFA